MSGSALIKPKQDTADHQKGHGKGICQAEIGRRFYIGGPIYSRAEYIDIGRQPDDAGDFKGLDPRHERVNAGHKNGGNKYRYGHLEKGAHGAASRYKSAIFQSRVHTAKSSAHQKKNGGDMTHTVQENHPRQAVDGKRPGAQMHADKA